VETRDIQGKWSDAGPVGHPAAPAACDYVWLEQELKEPRQVEALRLSFHPVEEKIVTANAGVLQDPAGQPKG
jgi:hypothetical protein